MSDVAFRHLVLAKWLTVAQAPDPFAPPAGSRSRVLFIALGMGSGPSLP